MCRRTRKSLRSKYDPTYHFRQVPANLAHPSVATSSAAAVVSTRPGGSGHAKSAAKGQPYSSYEEHLEKAARLNNEMSQYNQVYEIPSSSVEDNRHKRGVRPMHRRYQPRSKLSRY